VFAWRNDPALLLAAPLMVEIPAPVQLAKLEHRCNLWGPWDGVGQKRALARPAYEVVTAAWYAGSWSAIWSASHSSLAASS
jgi:hypothetical protein